MLLFLSSMCRNAWSGAEDTNVVQAAAADESAAWESVFTEEHQVPFHINFYMHDGLYYELMETSEYDAAFYTTIFSEKRRLTGRIGAKIHLDGAVYDQTGMLPPIDNTLAVRRIRVNTFGRAYFLTPLTYGIEFGLADGKFLFNDGYIWFHEVPYISSVRFGIFTAPFSMSALRSSSFSPLMETAAPVSAFAPGDMLGLQLGGAIPNERVTLRGGAFADVNDTENRDASQSYSRFIGRGTWLPFEGGGIDGSSRVHLGLSGSHMFAKDEGVRYRSRPESYLAPFLIDTGSLGGDRAMILGSEIAWQGGPMLVESEFMFAQADDQLDVIHRFMGGYAQVSFMITGEIRDYIHDAGRFSGVVPGNDFSFKNKTWGAWEWAARYSHTDLNDGSIRGGIMGVASTGLNLYLTARNRLMFDVGYANVDETIQTGELFFIQSRLQIDL